MIEYPGIVSSVGTYPFQYIICHHYHQSTIYVQFTRQASLNRNWAATSEGDKWLRVLSRKLSEAEQITYLIQAPTSASECREVSILNKKKITFSGKQRKLKTCQQELGSIYFSGRTFCCSKSQQLCARNNMKKRSNFLPSASYLSPSSVISSVIHDRQYFDLWCVTRKRLLQCLTF